MNTEVDPEKTKALIDLKDQSEPSSETRRRPLRAGLAAAPVLMVGKSRSVLACGGSYSGGGQKHKITCSAFASIRAAANKGIILSHIASEGYPCKSYDEWKVSNHPRNYREKHNCYFHANSKKPKRDYFNNLSRTDCKAWGDDPDYNRSDWTEEAKTGCTYAGFAKKTDQHIDRTCTEMLYCDDSLARHLVACILNKEAGLDPDNLLPDLRTCQAIWQNNGWWKPPNSYTSWYRADTLAWFDTIYGYSDLGICST